MRTRRGRGSLLLLAAGSVSVILGSPGSPARAQESAVTDPACGVEVRLPDGDWKMSDQSEGPVLVHVYSPDASLVPRFTLLQMPAADAPTGLAGRTGALEGLLRTRIRTTLAAVGGAEAQRIEYGDASTRTVEFGVKREGDYLVLQVAGAKEEWDDPRGRERLESILRSVRFVRGARPAAIDRATPAEVRAARRACEPAASPFSIRSHDIDLAVFPGEGRLACRDRLEVEAGADGLEEAAFTLTDVVVDSVRCEGKDLKWEQSPAGSLRVRLPVPLARGRTAVLECRAHSDDFLVRADQSLVEEVQVCGQVRGGFSFSSHAFYYPTIADDPAPVRLSIAVPDGFVAVGGGDPGKEERGEGRTVFRFEEKSRRPRPLPFGFAVGRYEVLRGETPGGLALEVCCAAGAKERGRSVLRVAERAAAQFESLMGPLPWHRVALCQVEPVRGEAGVSLPGLILLSDSFRRDIESARPLGPGLSDPATSGLIAVPDELSHQWNFYAALLPNELAEGLATFSDLLFLEKERGAAAYRDGVRDCARCWLSGAEVAGDVPLADPRLYASPAYRTVAFQKVPAVLHGLRRRLGEERFFRGFKAAIRGGRGGPSAYEGFRRAFEEAGGEDLGTFFDSWFFRAGFPKVAATWKAGEAGGKPGGSILLRQVQEGPPFEVDFDVVVRAAGGQESRGQVRMHAREAAIPWPLPSPPESIVVDPDETSLVRQVEAR